MLSLKDLVKEKRPADKLTINRLREFCRYYDDLLITHDRDEDSHTYFKIRCNDINIMIRLICEDGFVTDLGMMEYPNTDIFHPSFTSQVGDGLVTGGGSSSTMQDPSNTIVEADPSATAMPQEILTFVDDTATQKASLPEFTSPQAAVLAPGSELRNHTIEDILQRPVRISQQSWTVSQVQGTDLYDVAFPEAIINASNIVKDKLQNFTYLRADICVRVIINASTFQQGKLLAYFAPFSRVVGNRGALNDHLPAKTAFPHVVLDAATGNSGDLRIPFVNPYTHYNLTTQQGDMGNLKISVLNQLKTLTNCTVTVFAWFENIDLGVPTARKNLATLSARNVADTAVTTSDKEMIYNLIKSGVIRVKKSADTTGKLEFLTPYKSQVAEDREKSSTGIISETLEHIGGAAGGMKNLPIVGDVFKPVEWIANSASKVSALMGLSKPTSVETQSKFQNVPGFGFTNSDGLDQSVMLACKPDNQVQMRGDLFGSKVDEMDINYVAAHSCWFQTFEWKSSVDPLVAPLLNEIAVHPGICPFADDNYESTLLSFVSAPFRYWRGGLTYKVQAAKTSFHSGRIRIAFVPSGVLSQGYNLDTCYSWIMDLRTSDQMEFTIPYISNTQYKEVILAPVSGVPTTAGTTGVLVTEVLNALRAPDTVEQSIEINMWISGASDYQLAIPDFNRYKIGNGTAKASPQRDEFASSRILEIDEIPTEAPELVPPPRERPRTRRGAPDLDYDFSSGYESQVLGAFQDQGFNDFSDAAQMFGMKSTDQLTPKTLTIGEDVQNIRSLIKRFGMRAEGSITTRYANFYVNNGFFGEAEDEDVVALDYFSWMYRFYRGGQRYKFFIEPATVPTGAVSKGETRSYITPIPTTDTPYVFVSGVYNANGVPQPGTLQTNNAAPPTRYYRGTNFTTCHFPRLNPIVEVTVPYYANTPILPIIAKDGVALADIKYNAVGLGYQGQIILDHEWDGTNIVPKPNALARANVKYSTAAADDFSFGWLVGPPTLKDNT
jgi:hypothetical protein